jgi:hypothetical protein
MRRLIAIALPAALLLGAPSSAPAKGIMSAKVCGADGCQTIHTTEASLLEGGAPTSGPSRGEPFVRLNIRVGVPGHSEPVRLLFLPRSELLLADDGETWMVPMARAELRAIARRVKPFTASELPKSVGLAAGAVKASGEPLPPEIVPAPAQAAPTARDRGLEAWWFALPGGAIVLAAGVVVARRLRREPPPAAARAIG